MKNQHDYDLSKSAEIAKYIKDCVDDFKRDQRQKAGIIDKLKVVFNSQSSCQIKVLSGLVLSATCEKVLGKSRLPILQELLNEIDKDRYNGLSYH
jgi:hypothetical protein